MPRCARSQGSAAAPSIRPWSYASSPFSLPRRLRDRRVRIFASGFSRGDEDGLFGKLVDNRVRQAVMGCQQQELIGGQPIGWRELLVIAVVQGEKELAILAAD